METIIAFLAVHYILYSCLCIYVMGLFLGYAALGFIKSCGEAERAYESATQKELEAEEAAEDYLNGIDSNKEDLIETAISQEEQDRLEMEIYEDEKAEQAEHERTMIICYILIYLWPLAAVLGLTLLSPITIVYACRGARHIGFLLGQKFFAPKIDKAKTTTV